MGLATDVAIADGVFCSAFERDDVINLREVDVFGVDVVEVVNWSKARAGLEALVRMGCFDVSDYWRYYLDRARFPLGSRLEMSRDEAGRYVAEMEGLRVSVASGLALLRQLLPQVSLDHVTALMEVENVSLLMDRLQHVNRVVELCSVDDMIQVTSVQSGSVEFGFAGDLASSFALGLAVHLARVLGSAVADRVRSFMLLFDRVGVLEDQRRVFEEGVEDAARNEVLEEFWGEVGDEFSRVVVSEGQNANEARVRVNQAASEIVRNSESLGVTWSPPAAVVYGLAGGGVWAALNYSDPKAVAMVLRELAAPVGGEGMPDPFANHLGEGESSGGAEEDE